MRAVHCAKVAAFPNRSQHPDFPIGAIVFYFEGSNPIIVTVGVFTTEERAWDWANKTVTVYNAFPRPEAELREPPDDFDLRRVQ